MERISDVVSKAAEICGECIGTLTKARFVQDATHGRSEGFWCRSGGLEVDTDSRPCHSSAGIGLVLGLPGGDDRDAVADGRIYGAIAAVGDERVGSWQQPLKR